MVKKTKISKGKIHFLSFLESTIERRVELVLKRCEQSLNEKNLQIWTIVVKGLIFARPSLSNQYVEQVKFPFDVFCENRFYFCSSDHWLDERTELNQRFGVSFSCEINSI